jgi:hypothetical protein
MFQLDTLVPMIAPHVAAEYDGPTIHPNLISMASAGWPRDQQRSPRHRKSEGDGDRLGKNFEAGGHRYDGRRIAGTNEGVVVVVRRIGLGNLPRRLGRGLADWGYEEASPLQEDSPRGERLCLALIRVRGWGDEGWRRGTRGGGEPSEGRSSQVYGFTLGSDGRETTLEIMVSRLAGASL